MIHALRWLAILGTCAFLGWAQCAQIRRTAYRKRVRRTIEFNGRASSVCARPSARRAGRC